MATAVKLPKLPTYTNPIAEQDQTNIRWLLNPNPNFNEVDSRAAEMGLGQGGGFQGNNRMRLRDSELINRFTTGHQMLQPYLQREHATQSQTQGERAQLEQIAATGAQAMERLRLQESGMTARQSQAERAALQRAALEGQQAMERLSFSEGSASDRQRAELDNMLERFYAGESGQNARLDRTIGAEGEQQAARLAAADTQQLRDLENRLEVARITNSADAARLEQQLALERERINNQMRLAEMESRNRIDLARTQGAFDIASRLSSGGGGSGGGGGTGLRTGPGAGPIAGVGRDTTGGSSNAALYNRYGATFDVNSRSSSTGGGQFYGDEPSGGDQFGQQLSNVDRILRRYGVV